MCQLCDENVERAGAVLPPEDVIEPLSLFFVDAIGEFIRNEFDMDCPSGLAVSYLNEWLDDSYGHFANDFVEGFVSDYWESIDAHFPSIDSGSRLGILLAGLR